jgi:hypothetical protein
LSKYSQDDNTGVIYDDDLGLQYVFRVLLEGRWLLLGLGALAAVISAAVSLTIPNTYRAEALVAPVQEDSSGALMELSAQLGGLAALAGLNLGADEQDKTSLGMEVMRSRKFVASFIADHDAMVPLMASDGWDEGSGKLVIDRNRYDESGEKWVKRFWWSDGEAPTLLDAHEEFMEILDIREDNETGFIRISVLHHSPVLAKQWVDWIIDDINRTIMDQDVAEAQQAIDYLKEQIHSTSVAELQSVFYRLIEKKMETVMLAQVSDEYLFRTIDPAVVPEEKFKPSRTLITILGGLSGVLLASVILLFASLRQEEKQA